MPKLDKKTRKEKRESDDWPCFYGSKHGPPLRVYEGPCRLKVMQPCLEWRAEREERRKRPYVERVWKPCPEIRMAPAHLKPTPWTPSRQRIQRNQEPKIKPNQEPKIKPKK